MEGARRTRAGRRRRATVAFEEAERLVSAWGRAAAALELFDADGRLNDRTRAEAEIAAAMEDLTGADWSKFRNLLTDPRAWPSWTGCTGGWGRPSRGRIGRRRWPGDGGCGTARSVRRTR